MSEVWDRLISIQDSFIKRFQETGNEVFEEGMERFNQPGWINRVWTSRNYRRAHIDVVDARNTKGLWMMHCCVFPHTNNPAPIFGYDVVAGRNKITGFFHDFSSTGFPNHPLMEWFGNEVNKLEWRKTRALPDWAQRIFSPHMIAAGNVSKEDELEQIIDIGTRFLDHYLACVGETATDYIDNTGMQNIYCENQKLNPHTPKVMASLGLDENDVRTFIGECLFPEIR
jgi:hypothetical protein